MTHQPHGRSRSKDGASKLDTHLMTLNRAQREQGVHPVSHRSQPLTLRAVETAYSRRLALNEHVASSGAAPGDRGDPSTPSPAGGVARSHSFLMLQMARLLEAISEAHNREVEMERQHDFEHRFGGAPSSNNDDPADIIGASMTSVASVIDAAAVGENQVSMTSMSSMGGQEEEYYLGLTAGTRDMALGQTSPHEGVAQVSARTSMSAHSPSNVMALQSSSSHQNLESASGMGAAMSVSLSSVKPKARSRDRKRRKLEEVSTLCPDWHVDDATIARVEKNNLAKKFKASRSNFSRKSATLSDFEATEEADEEEEADVEVEGPRKGQCVMHPDGNFRFTLDIVGMWLLILDIIWLPLAVFPLGDSPIMEGMSTFTLLFWTMDIFMNFRTGIYRNGYLIWRPSTIAVEYVKLWFPFDLVIVTTDWVMFWTEGNRKFSASMRSVRIMRFLRLLRLFRLPRLKRILQNLKKKVQSTSVKLMFALIGHLFIILVGTHLLACAWYAIGNFSDTTGWIARYSLATEPVHYLYFSSLHWAIANMHGTMEVSPGNTEERVFAVIIQFCSMIVASWFISTMTEQLMELKILNQEKLEQETVMMDFLNERHVTTELRSRIKSLLDEELLLHEPKHLQELKLVQRLPKDLQEMVMDQTRRPMFVKHKLFSSFENQHTATLRHICYGAMSEVHIQMGTPVFKYGDACDRMMLLSKGRLTYLGEHKRGADDLVRSVSKVNTFQSETSKDEEGGAVSLGVGTFLCEAALWTLWQNDGDVEAVKESRLMVVMRPALIDVLSFHESAFVKTAKYAADFVAKMNSKGCTDLGLKERGARKGNPLTDTESWPPPRDAATWERRLPGMDESFLSASSMNDQSSTGLNDSAVDLNDSAARLGDSGGEHRRSSRRSSGSQEERPALEEPKGAGPRKVISAL